MAMKRWSLRGLGLVSLAAFLTCASPDTSGPPGGTVIAGRVVWSGPVVGATVVAHQLVDGKRTIEVGRGVTAPDGTYSLSTGDTYADVELDVFGGRFFEAATGGEVVIDAATVLQGVALELAIHEQRANVTISPWSHLAVTLGRARWAAGKEPGYTDAVGEALARLEHHLGFDAARTDVASLAAPAPGTIEPVRYALSLAALSALAHAIAVEQGASVQSVNTVELTRVLGRDAGSAEALFDGNGAERMFVGAACALPMGCSAEGASCDRPCAVVTNTLRSRLASAALAFLLDAEHNGTGLDRDDVEPWVENARTNTDPGLFGADPIDALDTVGPEVTWATPAAEATVAGTIAIDVTAADPLGVMSLTVTAETPMPTTLRDTNPAPERFEATLNTLGLPEGALTLTAIAIDTEGNERREARTVDVSNIDGGQVSGVVYKGRVDGATVQVFRFVGGRKGALAGTATTNAEGAFLNLAIADGVAGPLLVEAGGGGTYAEEAASATVTLDLNDKLRTVVPSYADGGALAGLVLSPLSSFAVTYFEYLQRTGQGGGDVAARWMTARSAMEVTFGVANLYNLTPLAPAEMRTHNAPARFGLVLLGLSELARKASTLGGGDGGTFGPAMNAMRVVRVLEADLSDGCFDGREGAMPLSYGGNQAVGTQATRLELANAIAGYLADGARNQTPFAGAVDVLPLLDTLARGGGNTALGSCTATERLHPDAGGPFDQVDPEIAVAPGDGAVVGGNVIVTATATDALDMRPTLRFTAPAGSRDQDSDETDADATATIATEALVPVEGPLAVTLEAIDDSGNRGVRTVTWQVDNRDPTVTIDGVEDGAWYADAVMPTVAASDAHLATFTVTLDDAPYTSGTPVTTEGRHVLVATARDTVGNTTPRTVTFYIDRTAPTLAVRASVPSGEWVRGVLELTVEADDTMAAFGSLRSDVVVTATGPSGGAVTPVSPPAPTTVDGRRWLVVRYDTNAIGDGALTVRFSVADRVGRQATPLVERRTVDNTRPTVALVATTNQTGARIDGYVSEQTATIRGTALPPGGSPVTLTLTLTINGTTTTAMVTPDAAGIWSYTTAALPEGLVSIGTAASDLAGNVAAMPPTGAFTVDRTGPTITLDASPVKDERNCDVTVNVNTSTGAIGAAPVNYGTCGDVTVNLAAPDAPVGKFTNRLTANAADNPLRWNATATDAGVGLVVAGVNVQHRVYRVDAMVVPPATWLDTSNPRHPAGTPATLAVEAFVTAAQWPETATHTAAFRIDLRAVDRLGNAGPIVSRTWAHHPLAPPVLVRYVGLPANDGGALARHALARYSLTPGAGQEDLAAAMSSGGLEASMPVGLYEFEVWNPHPQAVNVGFFIPEFVGASYTRRIWDVSAYTTGAIGQVTDPAGLCGWPARTISFRMVGGSAPYTCGSGTTCTCNGSGWAEPVDDKPAGTVAALARNDLSIVAWAMNGDVLSGVTRRGFTTTNGGAPFYEFVTPARVNDATAKRMRVFVALPNLDLFTPSTAATDTVQTVGVGTTATRLAPVMTVTLKERWADCRETNTAGSCTEMHARRRYRASVEARISVPSDTIVPFVRARAVDASTAMLEAIPSRLLDDGKLGGGAAVQWGSCETGAPSPCPTIPDLTNSVPY